MAQEWVIAQVKPRLRHCLEQRDRPGILALTTWLVHRHGHALLQQLLSQPEWSSHRLWWREQIDHLDLVRQPQVELPPQSHLKIVPTGKDHQDDKTQDKVPMGAKNTSDQPEPLSQAHDDIKITPARMTRQRLNEDGEIPTVTQAAGQKGARGKSPTRQHRSLYLRGWLPRSQLPHQFPQQDAA